MLIALLLGLAALDPTPAEPAADTAGDRPAPAPAAPAPSLSALAEKLRPSVVHLRTYDGRDRELGTGTGFFVSDDGLIATNVHVLTGARRVVAVTSGGAEMEVVGLVAENRDRDVALLATERDAVSLPLADDDHAAEGMKVVVMGNPLGLSWSVSEGIVSAIRSGGLPEELRSPLKGAVLQISAPIMPGSSGSPVVTLDGRVLGIVQGGMVGSDSLNFAVPAEAIRALMRMPPIVRPLHDPARLRNLVISLVVIGPLAAAWGVSWWRRRRRAERLADEISIIPRGRH